MTIHFAVSLFYVSFLAVPRSGSKNPTPTASRSNFQWKKAEPDGSPHLPASQPRSAGLTTAGASHRIASHRAVPHRTALTHFSVPKGQSAPRKRRDFGTSNSRRRKEGSSFSATDFLPLNVTCQRAVPCPPPTSFPPPLAHTAPALRGHRCTSGRQTEHGEDPKLEARHVCPHKQRHFSPAQPSKPSESPTASFPSLPTASVQLAAGGGSPGGGWVMGGLQRANKELSPCHHRPVTMSPAPCHRATSPGGRRPALRLQPSSPGFRGAAQKGGKGGGGWRMERGWERGGGGTGEALLFPTLFHPLSAFQYYFKKKEGGEGEGTGGV